MNETLVCYDSRLPNSTDLADVELNNLIDELAQKGVQVVVILDCCHSGGGSRGTTFSDIELGGARFAKDDDRQRTMDSYLEGQFSSAREIRKNPQHILLAACDMDEKAYELKNKSGLFSHNLLSVLKTTGTEINYFELFEKCRIKMLKVSDKQTPQFETYGFFNSSCTFLSKTEKDAPDSFEVYFKDGEWIINAGAVNHLPTAKGKSAKFAILKEGEIIGHAETLKVHINQSTLKFDYQDKQSYLQARLLSLPISPLMIGLEGSNRDLKKKAIAFQEEFGSFYFKISEAYKNTRYSIEIKDKNTFRIIDNTNDIVIRTLEGDNYSAMYNDIFEHLSKVAKWEKGLSLNNNSSDFDRTKVRLILHELDDDFDRLSKRSNKNIIFEVPDIEGKRVRQYLRFGVRNDNDQAIYTALFYMGSDYSMFKLANDFIPANSRKIIADKTSKGNQQHLFLESFEDSALSSFKLIVSTEKIPDTLLMQKGLTIGEIDDESYWIMRGEEQELGDDRAGMGDYNDDPIESIENDWYATTTKVELRRFKAMIGKTKQTFADGLVTIQAHDEFTGDVTLTASGTNGRAFNDMDILVELANKNGASLLPFYQNSRSTENLNTLEISNIKNKASLKDNPLILEINQELTEDEAILPVTFDGEFILPFGDLEQTIDGRTIIKIHDIPESAVSGRSLGGAIKMAFLKLAFKKETAKLRWVEYSESELSQNSDGINSKVDDAENILVCIHGIIGDTSQQAEFARTFYNTTPTKEQPHDLILTFDYENLNTPIEKIAANFKKALEDAGITENSGKKITILSHSMGGLVSRYFIEVLNGKKLVKHLIMAGTPNEGSRIGKVPNTRDKFLTLLGFALNFIGEIPFAGKIVKVLDGSKKVTVTLEQMDWEDDSNFLKNLAKSEDPGIPYTIIAGDMGKFMKESPKAKGLMNKMIKLGGRAFFGRQRNDLAVSVASIKSVSSKRKPQPVKLDAVCHHMNYFTDAKVERAFNIE